MKIFQYGGRLRAIGTMWLTMWPVTWPTEANENTRVARGTLSAITVGSSNLCTGPKFRAAAPNIVADQNFSVVLDLMNTLKANNGLQAPGVNDKKIFPFWAKRVTFVNNHCMTIQHHLSDITHEQVMHFNQGSKFATAVQAKNPGGGGGGGGGYSLYFG